ncbi:4-alpha-glucanotransferase [Neorhizobium sp. NPDC001467]|uniref:4-alpha-glucanotransferase n=1 Tax=Neorhizobium sp. NPDC001467 TaxID=3390595 RepID=UPI003D05DA33
MIPSPAASPARPGLPHADELDRIARRHGIALHRPSPDGREVALSDQSKRKLLAAIGIDLDATTAQNDARPSDRTTTSEPCFVPEMLSRERVWGLSLQLYELRSGRNWGIGDFEDLRSVIDLVATLKGDFIGLNPLHAPFLADPDRCSPYQPSNRLFLNPLYIAVDRLEAFETAPEESAVAASLRETDLVDYRAVATLKLKALRKAWHRWSEGNTTDGRPRQDLAAFVAEAGIPLYRHALFETLSADMVARGFGAGWQDWPEEFRTPQSSSVTEFAQTHASEIEFHQWLQWIAHRQLSDIRQHADANGLRIGLYLDLAVGEAIDGSATWSGQDIYLDDATIGSPPDPFAPDGQDWHLAGFKPRAIAAGDDPPFRRMVEAAMRYAGAIRIDHVAALRRLFLVPLDGGPADGGYVDYPQAALLKILAESSHRYRCLVIGEDLGLLPEGLQADLEAARILSYRILSYEHDEAGFRPAGAYPALALACISTHDHQTLAGWWRGADIAMRADHGIVSPELTKKHEADRDLERRDLANLLSEDGTLPPATARDADLGELTVLAHQFLARTASMVAAVRLADLTDEKRPTNVPGTQETYPNWRPKLSVSLEELASLPLVGRIAELMREERGPTAAGDPDRRDRAILADIAALRRQVASLIADATRVSWEQRAAA